MSVASDTPQPGERGGSECDARPTAKFLCEYIWRDYGILDVSPALWSAAAWTCASITNKRRIAGKNFIFDVRVGELGGVE